MRCRVIFLEIIINIIVKIYTYDFEDLFKSTEEEANMLKHYAILAAGMQNSNITKRYLKQSLGNKGETFKKLLN
jgi:hypothetical protein